MNVKIHKNHFYLMAVIGTLLFTTLYASAEIQYFQNFDIKSGINSPWAYSQYRMQKESSRAPDVNVQKTSGAASDNTQTFQYMIVNSENERRSNIVKKTGKAKFSLTNPTTRVGYLYWLAAKRTSGGYWASEKTKGIWDLH